MRNVQIAVTGEWVLAAIKESMDGGPEDADLVGVSSENYSTKILLNVVVDEYPNADTGEGAPFERLLLVRASHKSKSALKIEKLEAQIDKLEEQLAANPINAGLRKRCRDTDKLLHEASYQLGVCNPKDAGN